LSFVATPGSASDLISSRTLKLRGSNSLDPKRPYAPRQKGIPPPLTPTYYSSAFSLKAVPKDFLEAPRHRWSVPMSMSKRYEGYGVSKDTGRMAISAQFISTKALRGACIKNRIKNKIKNAVGIVMTKEFGKGASSTAKDDGLRPLPDWTYIFIPTLELYRLPSTDLIELVRKSLVIVNTQAKAIELPDPQETAPFPTRILERTNGLEAEGNGEDEDAPISHDSLWEVNSLGDDESTLSAELDVGDILSPNISNLPVWARPDFAARQEFTTAQGNGPELSGNAISNFNRRMWRGKPIIDRPSHHPNSFRR